MNIPNNEFNKDDQYCLNVCHKGKKAKSKILDDSESVFDAVEDIRDFICKCKKTCSKTN